MAGYAMTGDGISPGPDVEPFRSAELEQLMDRVQDLLSAAVVCMVLRDRTSGQLSVACPPEARAEAQVILCSVDWRMVMSRELS